MANWVTGGGQKNPQTGVVEMPFHYDADEANKNPAGKAGSMAMPGPGGQMGVQAPGLQAAAPVPAAGPQPTTPKPGENWVAVGGNWVPPDHPLAQQAQPTAGGQPAAGGGAPGQATTPTIAGAFQQALLNRLAPQDVSSSNPAISGSITANRNAEQRGLSKTQEALAERAAATGQSGAQETGLRQAIGESAGRQGAFEGNALFGLHQQQQNDLTDALGLGGNLLDSQQRQDLQRYGMDLDATLRREGLAAQTGLGGRELDIRNDLGKGNLGLGYAGLLQGGEQFRQGLGANMGIEQARLNQQALLALLGGL